MAENDDNKELDWAGVDPEMARTILAQSETYLKAQLDISLASDRRALTVGSIFATVAIGTAGATIAHYADHKGLPILLAGITTAAFMVLAAWFCYWSSRPIFFYSPGSHPKQWWPVRTAPIAEVIGGETENYQNYIEHNEKCLAANARALERGSRFAITAPIAGLIVWLASLYLFPS